MDMHETKYWDYAWEYLAEEKEEEFFTENGRLPTQAECEILYNTITDEEIEERALDMAVGAAEAAYEGDR